MKCVVCQKRIVSNGKSPMARASRRLSLCGTCYYDRATRKRRRMAMGLPERGGYGKRKGNGAAKTPTPPPGKDSWTALGAAIADLDVSSHELAAVTEDLAAFAATALTNSRHHIDELTRRIQLTRGVAAQAEQRVREANAEARRTVKLTRGVVGHVRSLALTTPGPIAPRDAEARKG